MRTNILQLNETKGFTMKAKTNCLLSIAAALVVGSSFDAPAQSWQTVLDYQSAAGWFGAASDPHEIFWGVGKAVAASNIDHGLVFKTDTTAAAWYLSDDLVPSPPYTAAKIFGLGFDANGNLYQSGALIAPCTQSSCPGDLWFIRKSADRG